MMANYENTPVDRSITSSMMTRSNYLLSARRYLEVLIGEFLITLYSTVTQAGQKLALFRIALKWASYL